MWGYFTQLASFNSLVTSCVIRAALVTNTVLQFHPKLTILKEFSRFTFRDVYDIFTTSVALEIISRVWDGVVRRINICNHIETYKETDVVAASCSRLPATARRRIRRTRLLVPLIASLVLATTSCSHAPQRRKQIDEARLTRSRQWLV